MSPAPKLAAVLTLLTCHVFLPTVRSIPNTQIQSVLCNSGVYSKGDPFGVSLAYIVKDLQTATPTSHSFDYFNVSPYPNAFAFGHAVCNINLTTSSDCSTCLDAAKTALFSTCVSNIGARSVLSDCTIRYEQYPFDD
ncbi:hypothetical protein M5689_003662 [Euphorbia peplus]|nr:hypothetical protein M5689_003662 [Euphorbia peplus]